MSGRHSTFAIACSLPALLLASALALHAQQTPPTPWQEDFAQGTLALREARNQDAIRSFTAVTRENPSFAPGYLNLGLALSSAGQHAEAVAALNHAAKLNPHLRGAHLFLGIENYNLSRFAEAESALKIETEQYPKDSKAWMWLGVAAMSEGKTAVAAHALDQAAALDSENVDIAYHRGHAHMQLAQEIYAEMFNKHPNSWRIHQVLAQSYEVQDNKAEAIVEYRRAIESAPGEPGLHEALGDIYWDQNQTAEARKVYLEEIRIDPSNANALFKAGAIAVEESDLASAEPLLRHALDLNPKLYEARFWLGRTEESTSRFAEAAQDFELVLAASPDDIDTQIITEYHAAQVYRKLRQTARWSAALARFQQLRAQQTENSDKRLAEKRKVQLGMKHENLDDQNPDQAPRP